MIKSGHNSYIEIWMKSTEENSVLIEVTIWCQSVASTHRICLGQLWCYRTLIYLPSRRRWIFCRYIEWKADFPLFSKFYLFKFFIVLVVNSQVWVCTRLVLAILCPWQCRKMIRWYIWSGGKHLRIVLISLMLKLY